MSAICIWKRMDMWEICIKEFYEKEDYQIKKAYVKNIIDICLL